MKKLNISFILAFAIAIVGTTSCQKTLEGNLKDGDKLSDIGLNAALSTCAIPVTGQITSNTTWTTGNVYLLQGIVEVNGAKLTIQPGAVVLGEKATKGGLVINRNAEIEAIGTECSPIIFTSDQSPGNRAPGDYFGLALMGNAPNNQSNSLVINIHGTNYTAGGTSATSSVGTLKYVQIHYAGSGSTAGPDPRAESALILGSLGSGSVIEHVQITNSARDGLGVWGGEPTFKYIFNYEVVRTDFRLSYGTKANAQFLIGFKDQATAFIGQPSYGIEVTNNLLLTDVEMGDNTYPTISQLTLLGGDYCNGDSNFERGIQIARNGNARIYNSLVSSFSQQGLFLSGDPVVVKTAASTEQLQFSYNTIHEIGAGIPAGYGRSITGTWAGIGGCNASALDDMTQWLNGSVPVCGEAGNLLQPTSFSLGYSNLLCGNKCSAFPSLNINEDVTDLPSPNYEALNLTIFDEAPYPGALQAGEFEWIQECNWMNFCMQTQGYCL